MNKAIQLLIGILLILQSGCVSDSGGQGNVSSKRSEEAAIVYVKLGVDYMQKENFALAEKNLLKALTYSSKMSLTNWTYAVLQEKLGYDKKAETYFKKAIRLNKKDAEAFNVYGAFLCRKDRVEEAIKAFDAAINNPLYNRSVDANLNAADCLMQQQQYDRSRAYIDYALNMNEDSAKANFFKAKLYYHEGKYAESSILRKRISVAASDNPGVLWLCVMTERQLGDRNTEAVCTKNLLRRYPTSPEAESI